MAVISAGTTTTTALVQTGDTTGNLVIKTGSSGTTALTVSGADQSVTFAGAVNVSSSAFALGSVSAPSITFTGDTNTGIYSPAADTIAFTEGGTESMRITSAGDVGIGTSTPVSQLHLVSASDSGLTIYKSAVGAGNVRVVSQGGGSALAFGSDQSTGTTERMRIDSSGNVGIGTSSPAYKLQVNGGTSTRISADTTGGTYYTRLVASQTFAYSGIEYSTLFNFVDGATERMRITSSGNVLIGTTTGNYQLSTDTTFYNAAQLGLLTTGRSGTEYPSVGYNVRYTSTFNTYTYNGGDFASMIRFQSGQVQTFTAANGTGGNAISFTSGPYVANGGTSWTNSSDERLKDIIEPIENGITKVSSLRAVIGKFKTDEEGTRRSFLIAQDVQAVLPEAVDSSDPDKLGVQYTDVIPLLVAAIQELNAKVTALEAQLENK